MVANRNRIKLDKNQQVEENSTSDKEDKARNKRVQHIEKVEPMEEQTSPDLTVRGTPRIRRKKRTREEIGGDPNAEANKWNVRIGGRVGRDLRDQFVACTSEQGISQGQALTEALQDYLEKHSCNTL